ncbi:unnamed protein product [Spirodela intermedia]|uniref:Uncharacterized protein n=1 Tax=Spirodela intermedia TaxID=51605 RepID=A0A7I8KTG6_SPIIN|nr:unnamed protein product [Spirodela intermedia]
MGNYRPVDVESKPADGRMYSSSSSSSSSDRQWPICRLTRRRIQCLGGGGARSSRGSHRWQAGRESNRKKDAKKCQYRHQLEREVQKLQAQLQEEIDLHVALAGAIGLNASSLNSPFNLPDKAQELVGNIITLEITVSKLEDELNTLHRSITRARNERELSKNNSGNPSSPSSRPECFSDYSWEEHISSLRASKSIQAPHSLETIPPAAPGHPQSLAMDNPSGFCKEEEGSQSCSTEYDETEVHAHLEQVDATNPLSGDLLMRNLWHNPNQLSEEMVRCMRNIFLCLSEASTTSSKVSSSEGPVSLCSPIEPVSNSSRASLPDSSVEPSLLHSPLMDMRSCPGVISKENAFDPYGVHGKANRANLGTYSSATEVSWMVVGKKQLEYAAETLRTFRFLVEQLVKVSPAKMNSNQKLAFWINLYNALVMHAYLAYGVPRNDIKHFSLMQKVSYTIGDQSVSAAEIEYVILKMKPPAYRPHIGSVLAMHKFKISEEHKKFSIDNPEPLVAFGLSCGMHSSPAIRIFTPSRVKEELQIALRDYVRASVGIGLKGKLLVPKLLHCFAKAVVEDSLLVDWICRFLSPEQAALVRNSTSHRKQRLLGVRSFIITPFDSRFRYLFLTDDKY